MASKIDLNDVRVLLREYMRKDGYAAALLARFDSSGQLLSTASPGTPPIVVSSDAMVASLNADMVDGYHAADVISASHDLVEKTRIARFVVGNGTDVISTGAKETNVLVPIGGTVTGWSAMTFPSGTIEFDVLGGTRDALPPATSITGGDYPTVTEDNKAYSDTLTGWTTSLSEGDVLDVNVISCSGVTKAFLDLLIQEV